MIADQYTSTTNRIIQLQNNRWKRTVQRNKVLISWVLLVSRCKYKKKTMRTVFFLSEEFRCIRWCSPAESVYDNIPWCDILLCHAYFFLSVKMQFERIKDRKNEYLNVRCHCHTISTSFYSFQFQLIYTRYYDLTANTIFR